MTIRMLNPATPAENLIDSTNDRVAARVSGPSQLEAHVRVDFAIPVSAWSGDLASLGPTTGVSVYDVADQLLGRTVQTAAL